MYQVIINYYLKQ